MCSKVHDELNEIIRGTSLRCKDPMREYGDDDKEAYKEYDKSVAQKLKDKMENGYVKNSRKNVCNEALFTKDSKNKLKLDGDESGLLYCICNNNFMENIGGYFPDYSGEEESDESDYEYSDDDDSGYFSNIKY